MSKLNFSHLGKLAANNIVEYRLEYVGESAVLLLRSPSEGNKDYTNDVLRLTGHADGSRKRKIKVNAKFMDESRKQDRELYPKHVITGWKGIVDIDDKEVEFSVEAATEFLQALPDWIFDEIRLFAQEPSNFIKQISPDKGKN